MRTIISSIVSISLVGCAAVQSVTGRSSSAKQPPSSSPASTSSSESSSASPSAVPAAATTSPREMTAAECTKIQSAPRYTWDERLDQIENHKACYALKTAGIANPYRPGCKPRDADAICNEELAAHAQAYQAKQQQAKAEATAAADAEAARAALESRQMPKPGMRNKALEQQLAKLLKQDLEPGATLLKVVISDDGWRVERNEATGIVEKRWMYYQHAIKRADGRCFLSDGDWFYQEHLGSKFGPTEVHGMGKLAEIKCERVK